MCFVQQHLRLGPSAAANIKREKLTRLRDTKTVRHNHAIVHPGAFACMGVWVPRDRVAVDSLHGRTNGTPKSLGMQRDRGTVSPGVEKAERTRSDEACLSWRFFHTQSHHGYIVFATLRVKSVNTSVYTVHGLIRTRIYRASVLTR